MRRLEIFIQRGGDRGQIFSTGFVSNDMMRLFSKVMAMMLVDDNLGNEPARYFFLPMPEGDGVQIIESVLSFMPERLTQEERLCTIPPDLLELARRQTSSTLTPEIDRYLEKLVSLEDDRKEKS